MRGPSFLTGSDRDRIILAAAQLCAERGEELDEKDVAKRASVEVEVLQEIFPGGTGDCLVAAENAILFAVVAAVSRTYAADRSEWENVIGGVLAILELMAENPSFAYLGYIGARQMAHQGQVKDIYDSGHQVVQAMLERGWDYSGRRAMPTTVVLGVLGGAEALVRRELAAGRAAELPALLPDCVYIATVPFLGQRESLRLSREAAELLREEHQGAERPGSGRNRGGD